MSQPFDPASRAERALVVEQERLARLTNTRVAYGDVVDPPATGRWAKPAQSPDPSQLYPRLPEGNSQWGGPQVPEEPPLGYSVNDLEPVGEFHELVAERDAAVVTPPDGSADLVTIGSATAAGLPNATPSLSPGVAEVEGSPLLSSVVDPASPSGGSTMAHPSAPAPATSKGEGARGIEPVLKGGTLSRSFRRFG